MKLRSWIFWFAIWEWWIVDDGLLIVCWEEKGRKEGGELREGVGGSYCILWFEMVGIEVKLRVEGLGSREGV